MIRQFLGILSPFFLSVPFIACNNSMDFSKTAGGMGGLGSSISQFSDPRGPKDPSKAEKGSAGGATLGSSCKDGDQDHLCLALKYVVYRNSNGESTASRNNVASDLAGINQVWNQCNIGFQVEQYVAADPEKNGLQFLPSELSELTEIRNAFLDDTSLLVVTTGTWNRAGTLGSSAANAWTSMPGEPPYGAVLEKPVGTFANIIAHEIGHYLGLPHVSNEVDLMNPIIYDNSESLTAEQCSAARRTISSYWQKMIR